MTEINRYHVFINTELRSSGTSSDFSIPVNPPLVKVHPNNYFVAQIVSVEIPYSWLQVNSGNNTLPILYAVNGGTLAPYTITLTSGNYNINTLITALKNAIDAVIPPHTWTHNYVYNQDTGKLTFGILNAGAYTGVAIAINFPNNSFLARMFGCLAQSNIVYGWDGTTYQTVAGSTNVNVNPVSSIYIRSTNIKQIKNQESMVVGSGQDPSDILCKLQIYTPPRTYVFYNGELGLSARITNVLIDKLDIYLSDNYSFDLDMMNNDWTFRITFIEYEPPIDTVAEQISRPLNSKMNDTHLFVPPPVKNETEQNGNTDVAPATNSRRFQK